MARQTPHFTPLGCVSYLRSESFSEICVFSVDEEAERGQGRPQFGGLAAGCRQEGVVL